MSAQRFPIDPEADGRHDVGKMESCSHTERRTVTHIHTVGEQQQRRILSALSHSFSLLLSFLGTLSGNHYALSGEASLLASSTDVLSTDVLSNGVLSTCAARDNVLR